jgi:hypothetical protein
MSTREGSRMYRSTGVIILRVAMVVMVHSNNEGLRYTVM